MGDDDPSEVDNPKPLYLVRFTTIVPVFAQSHDEAKCEGLDYLEGQIAFPERWTMQSAEVKKAAALPKGIGHLKPFNAKLGSATCKEIADAIEQKRLSDEKYQLKLFPV